jgi:hypothetical protein
MNFIYDNLSPVETTFDRRDPTSYGTSTRWCLAQAFSGAQIEVQLPGNQVSEDSLETSMCDRFDSKSRTNRGTNRTMMVQEDLIKACFSRMQGEPTYVLVSRGDSFLPRTSRVSRFVPYTVRAQIEV